MNFVTLGVVYEFYFFLPNRSLNFTKMVWWVCEF